MHAGKVIGYSVITTTGVPKVLCVCVCVRECYKLTCVSSLVYWQICPSSIRLNWPQWWRTLIYLAWASHWSTSQPHNPSRTHTHTHTPTQSVITFRIGPRSTALNMAELHGRKRNNENSDNSAAVSSKVSAQQSLPCLSESFRKAGERITNVAFKASSITHWSAQ